MGDVKPLLVVTGTQREGGLVAGAGVIVLAGGGDAARLAEDLHRLGPDACGIISFGTCGGLVAGQAIGAMVIGSGVNSGEIGECDPAWVQALGRALPHARIGPVFANGTLLASAEQRRLAARGGAIIVDMESHIVAAAAGRHRLPFVILRCISDTAEAALPPAVAVAMRPDGGMALGAVVTSVLRRPRQLPLLIRTGREFGRAFAALQAGARAVGPRLGFDQR